ncbi:MAG TPA: two-component regulator propeller domain-containing protein [Agriterribacter sp.]|nr:two-component regulator propeller domain-containing protein [Agriterribacter sp.]
MEDGRSLHSNYISAIIEDKAGNIWIGTSNGIDVLDKKNKVFRYLGHDDGDSSSLSNNNVIALLLDSRQMLWAGTREGLNLLNKENKMGWPTIRFLPCWKIIRVRFGWARLTG